MKSAEYAMVTIIVLVIAYLVVTPIVKGTTDRLNYGTELIVEATNGNS